jgi:putative salt-induced outer membrane protein YdiY
MKALRALIVFLAAGLTAAPVLADEPCPCAEKKGPPPAFTGNAGFGLGINRGNTNSANLNFTLGLKYDPKTRNVVTLKGYYLYGRTNGVTDTQKANFDLRDQYSFAERFFAFGSAGYLFDRFKGLTYLITPTVGAGYKVVKTKAVTLDFSGGVGVWLEQDAGIPSTTSGSFSVDESFEWQISSLAKLTEHTSGRWRMNNTSAYFFHLDAGIVSPISGVFELKLTFVLDYQNEPYPPTLEKTDSSLLVTIAAKF